jgi:hypothetical protein
MLAFNMMVPPKVRANGQARPGRRRQTPCCNHSGRRALGELQCRAFSLRAGGQHDPVKRREFIAGLGSAVASPVAVRAQLGPVIGASASVYLCATMAERFDDALSRLWGAHLPDRPGPSRGGMPPLTSQQAEELRVQASEWALMDGAHRVERTFRFQDFRESPTFVQKVGELAVLRPRRRGSRCRRAPARWHRGRT